MIGLFDEREYFLAELALIAGSACRFLFDREAARRWFDRGEATFSRVINAGTQAARLAYQKLALAVEERRFDEVLELVPLWVETFEEEELWEDALKFRFLEGLSLREKGELTGAISLFRDIYQQAEGLGNRTSRRRGGQQPGATPSRDRQPRGGARLRAEGVAALPAVGNRVGLVKLRWCVGDILREQAKLGEAIEAYREALAEAGEVGMRGDVAAIHLVLADVLLSVGQDRQAEWEIRAALPIIDEEKMVPEGYAALSLLRQSLQSHRINGEALRNLHGFFRDSES